MSKVLISYFNGYSLLIWFIKSVAMESFIYHALDLLQWLGSTASSRRLHSPAVHICLISVLIVHFT